ncbi:MAG: tRNA 2-thiouridine(34) synthase MnmA [Calditrichia bacterium]
MNTTGKVAVAMSGGVDSSVAAALLQEQGFEVIGVTMKLWNYDDMGGNRNLESSCCSVEAINDARLVCQRLDIPHYVMDLSSRFNTEVIQNFIEEYLLGRTPNPCVLCNTRIKWEALLQRIQELGADYLATGHYARVQFNENSGRYELLRSSQLQKDQSYALWGLNQESLSHTIFPLGDFSKDKVREIAGDLNLKNARKSESQEICFIPDNDYHRFLKENGGRFEEGPILTTDGEQVGRHSGYPFFTIGQRRGIGVGLGKPMYVVELIPEKNAIVIGEKQELKSAGLLAAEVNWIKYPGTVKPMPLKIKIRYNDSLHPAELQQLAEDEVEIRFKEPLQAVTPGQSVVFYEGESLVGGGIIRKALK